MPQGRLKNKDAVNSNTREAVLENEATWLEKAMKESQKEGKAYYPTLSQAAFDKLKRNRDSLLPGFWSDEDEAEVQSQWRLDLTAKPIRKPHPKEHGVWKTCARFLRCLPTELIGMRYGLECDAQGEKAQNWTQSFCGSLETIIAHPIFANNPAMIALAIKFSVCSWQRLKWNIPDLPDLFLQVVRRVAEDNGEMLGAALVRDSIKQWRRSWPEQGELPPWAHLLRAIVANSKRPISEPDWPHRVATHHLSAIVTSVDEITHAKLVLFHSASLCERWTKDLRANIDRPIGDEDAFERLQADGTVHNRRLKALSERYPDVGDIYKHVSVPEAHRPLPKEDYADICVDDGAEPSSEAEEPARPPRPARPAAQANPGEKRKRGRPRKIKPANETPVEDDDDANEESGDAVQAQPSSKRGRGRPKSESTAAKKSETPAAKKGEAAAAPKRRGQPFKSAEWVDPRDDDSDDEGAAPVSGGGAAAQAPEGTVPAVRPNIPDAAAAGLGARAGRNARRVQGRHLEDKRRTRTPSVPDSTINAGEQPAGSGLRHPPRAFGGDPANDDWLLDPNHYMRAEINRHNSGGSGLFGNGGLLDSGGEGEMFIDDDENPAGGTFDVLQEPRDFEPRPTTSRSHDLGARTSSNDSDDLVIPTTEYGHNEPANSDREGEVDSHNQPADSDREGEVDSDNEPVDSDREGEVDSHNQPADSDREDDVDSDNVLSSDSDGSLSAVDTGASLHVAGPPLPLRASSPGYHTGTAAEEIPAIPDLRDAVDDQDTYWQE